MVPRARRNGPLVSRGPCGWAAQAPSVPTTQRCRQGPGQLCGHCQANFLLLTLVSISSGPGDPKIPWAAGDTRGEGAWPGPTSQGATPLPARVRAAWAPSLGDEAETERVTRQGHGSSVWPQATGQHLGPRGLLGGGLSCPGRPLVAAASCALLCLPGPQAPATPQSTWESWQSSWRAGPIALLFPHYFKIKS